MVILRKAGLRLAFLAGMALTTGTAHAQVNGSFETGDFTAWNTLGNTSVQNATIGVAPTSGTYQADLYAGSENTTSMEAFLGLNSGVLNGAYSGLTQGSAIARTVTVKAGDVLTFDFNYRAHDYLPYNDPAFFTVSSSSVKLLSDISAVGNYGTTGYKSYSYTFASTGTYTVGFSVFNQLDNSANSELLVDNMKLTNSVPEPGSVALLAGMSVSGMGFLRRKRRK